MKSVTITSKGQITLPAEFRRKLGLKKLDRLVATIDSDAKNITLSRPMAVDDIARFAHKLPKKKIKPIADASKYYQQHRGEHTR